MKEQRPKQGAEPQPRETQGSPPAGPGASTAFQFEDQIQAFVEVLPDATVIIDGAGRIIAWNRPMEELTGIPKARAVGQTGYLHGAALYGRSEPILVDPVDLVARQDRAAESKYIFFERSGSSVSAVSFAPAARNGQGAFLWGTASVLFDAEGNRIGAIESIRDITHQKRIEEELRLSRERLRLALDATGDGLWDWNLPAGKMYLDQGCLRMLGWEGEEGEYPFAQLMEHHHQEDLARIMRGLEQRVQAGSSDKVSIEYRIRLADGEFRWVLSRGKVMARDRANRPVRILGVVSDQTERRRLEAQIQQGHKMESIGRLAGGIAHDFNNLLTVILSGSDLALMSIPEETPAARDVQSVREAALRASQLTQQLLTFARQQPHRPTVHDLNDLVREIAQMLGRLIGEDIELHFDLAPDAWRVTLDRGQFEQVLVNLVVNARDAMPGGGAIWIRTRNVVQFERPYAQLTVTDSGCGMTEEVQAHLFEPFFTTKEVGKGTGLGLATCYGIVQQNGGQIDVESAPGCGTTFRILLPKTDAPTAAEWAAGLTGEPLFCGTERILVVEDEEEVRNLIVRILSARGYRVFDAANREKALSLIQSVGARFDLILTDVVMPGGGMVDLAQELQSRHPATKVLLMSGYAEGRIGQALPEGVEWPLLEKPFSPVSLLGKVREVLGR